MPVTASADEAAHILATEVMKGGETAVPALLSAMERAGWFVVDAKGEVLQRPLRGQGMGIAIDSRELIFLTERIGQQPIKCMRSAVGKGNS